MSKVFFCKVQGNNRKEEISKIALNLLKHLVEKEKLTLEKEIPLKVHFGEKGNDAYISPESFNGIINFLKENSIESSYLETNVLYHGERTKSQSHVKLAKEHGFNQLPIVIADGEEGELYDEIEIEEKHFKKCKIAKNIANKNQIIFLSHFKGHIFAGFGGAIKQLAMGCASRGGKLAQHANSKPKVSYFKCKACGACVKNCPVNAISLKTKAKINKDTCIGCASCVGICGYKAIYTGWLASFFGSFNERLAEYAFAASKGKNHIYINFAINITKGCDCIGHKQKLLSPDIGIFASLDPVSIDMACIDIINKTNDKRIFKKGMLTLNYAEKIGVGKKEYELIEIL